MSETPVIGDWTSLSFTYEQQPHAAPALVQLGLANDTGENSGDGITADTTVSGRISCVGDPEAVVIQFHFGEGIADQSTTADGFGQFAYQLKGLTEGSVTVHVRAWTLDEDGQQVLYGPWNDLSFTYQIPADDPPTVAEVGLANDTGSSSTDGVTTDPTLAGQISNDGAPAGLEVEFDYDGDEVVDGATTTDAEGSFTFTPSGLQPGSITIHVRAKQPRQDAVPLYSEWSTFQFTLESETPTDLRVSDIGLSVDSGTAGDGVTNNATLAGHIAGAVPLAGVTVQFDTNGDGLCEGTATVAANGSFQYSPQSLTEGRVTIQARTSSPDVSGSEYSEWRPITFVFYLNALSESEGQAIATAYGGYDAAWQAALNAYNQAAAAADTAHRQAQATAQDASQSARADAAATRSQTENTAEQDYQAALADADEAYRAAMGTAYQDLVTRLAAFSGDTTSYVLTDFVWPEAPVDNALVIPDDGKQPSTGIPGPIYAGMAFDFQADPQYRQAVQTAEQQYQTTVHNADHTLQTAKQTAQQDYQQAIGDAAQDYQDTMETAWEDYLQSLENPNCPIDVEAEYAEYGKEVTKIESAYQSEMAAHGVPCGEVWQTAWEEYVEISNAAYAAWQATGGFLYTSEWVACVVATENAMLQYWVKSWTATRLLGEQNADSWLARAKALDKAHKDLVDAVAPYDAWMQKWKADREHDYVVDVAQAEEDWTVSLASAKETMNKAVADAVKVRSLAVAQADSALRQTRIQAAQDAILAGANLSSDSWSQYQAQLVQNWATYASAVDASQLAWDNVAANAIWTQRQADAATEKARADAIAGAQDGRLVDKSIATRDYRKDTADAGVGRITGNAAVTQDEQDSYAQAKHDYLVALDAAEAAYMISIYTSEHDRNVGFAMIAMERNQDWQDWYETQMGGDLGPPWDETPYEQRYQDLSVQYLAERYVRECNDGVAKVEALRAPAETITLARRVAVAGRLGTECTWARSLSDSAEDFETGLADADRQFTITVADAYGAEQLDKAAARLTCQETTIDAGKVFADAVASQQRANSNAAAAAWNGFRAAVAADYVSALTAWQTAQPSAWADYLVGLAHAEKARIVASGAAELEYATTTNAACYAQTMKQNLADRAYAYSEAGADASRTDEFVDAQDQFATSLAGTRKGHAAAVATAITERDKEQADDNKGFRSAVAEAERERQDQIDDAEYDYQVADYQAMLAVNLTSLGLPAASVDLQAAAETRRRKIGDAEVAFIDSTVGARVGWIGGSADTQVDFVDDLGDAAAGYAGGVSEATATLADDRATAEKDYGVTMHAAEVDWTHTYAVADFVYTNAVAAADADWATAEDALESTFRKATVAARSGYETALFARHAAATLVVSLAEQTPLAAYQCAVAAADVTRSQAVGAARSGYEGAVASAYAAWTDQTNRASLGQTAAASSAELFYTIGMAGVDQARADAWTAAEEDYTADAVAADADKLASERIAQADYDRGYAAAERDYRNDMAETDAAWSRTIARGERNVRLDGGSRNDWDTAFVEAQYVRDLGYLDAVIAFATAQRGVQIVLATDQGQAAIDHASDMGEAEIAATTAINAAEEAYATACVPLDQARTEATANAQMTYALAAAEADCAETVALGSADVAWSTALAQADRARAVATAEGQADYHAAVAADLDDRWAAQATQTNTARDHFGALAAHAQWQWTDALGPGFVAYVTDVADAAADAEVAMAKARATQDTKEADAGLTYTQATAPLDVDYAVATETENGNFQLGEVQRENDWYNCLASADKTQAVDKATADKDYNVARATALKDFDIAYRKAAKQYQIDQHDNNSSAGQNYSNAVIAAGNARDEADDDARIAMVTAKADVDVTYTADMAEANTVWRLEESAAQANHTMALAAIDRAYAMGFVEPDAAWSLASAKAQVGYWSAERKAEDARNTAVAAAWADFRSADYTALVPAIQGIDDDLDSPWSGFRGGLAAAGQTWWTEQAPEYQEWFADANAVYDGYQTELNARYLARASVEVASQSAHTTALALADEAYAVGQAVIDCHYEQTVAPAEEEYLNATAQANRDYQIGVVTQSVGRGAGDCWFAWDSAMTEARNDYAQVEIPANNARRLDNATLDQTYTQTTTAADVAQVAADQAAWYTYRAAESAAYADQEVALADLQRDYRNQEAASYSTAVADFADDHDTPWAHLAADQAAARADWTASVGEARVAYVTALAGARSTAEIALAGAAQVQANAEAVAEATRQRADAQAAVNQAMAQNAADLQLLGADGYQGREPDQLVQWSEDQNQPEDKFSQAFASPPTSGDVFFISVLGTMFVTHAMTEANLPGDSPWIGSEYAQSTMFGGSLGEDLIRNAPSAADLGESFTPPPEVGAQDASPTWATAAWTAPQLGSPMPEWVLRYISPVQFEIWYFNYLPCIAPEVSEELAKSVTWADTINDQLVYPSGGSYGYLEGYKAKPSDPESPFDADELTDPDNIAAQMLFEQGSGLSDIMPYLDYLYGAESESRDWLYDTPEDATPQTLLPLGGSDGTGQPAAVPVAVAVAPAISTQSASDVSSESAADDSGSSQSSATQHGDEDPKTLLKQRLLQMVRAEWTDEERSEFLKGIAEGFLEGLTNWLDLLKISVEIQTVKDHYVTAYTPPLCFLRSAVEHFYPGKDPLTNAAKAAEVNLREKAFHALEAIRNAQVILEAIGNSSLPQWLVTLKGSLATFVPPPDDQMMEKQLGSIIDLMDPILVKIAADLAGSPRAQGKIVGLVAYEVTEAVVTAGAVKLVKSVSLPRIIERLERLSCFKNSPKLQSRLKEVVALAESLEAPAKLFGLSKARQISSYAESDLSRFALEFRKSAGIGRKGNVVAIEYELNGVKQPLKAFTTVGAGGSHGEFIAKGALPDGARLTRLFTERQPCQLVIPNCDRMLARDFPNAEITFLVEYGDDASRKAGNKALDAILKALGL